MTYNLGWSYLLRLVLKQRLRLQQAWERECAAVAHPLVCVWQSLPHRGIAATTS